MHGVLQWAEFVPVAPLLPVLAEVAGYFVAFGLCVVASYLVRALFQQADSAFGWIPWVGSKITGDLHKIEQRITNYLGGAAAALDQRMAVAWHKLAHTAEWMGHEIAANAGTLLAIATVLTQPWSIPAWKQLYHSLVTQGKAVVRLFRAEVHSMLRPITGELHGLERWTYPRVKSLEREIGHTIDVSIPALRARARKIEDSLLSVYDRLAKLEGVFATTAFAGAVAVALGSLGLGWLRCNSLRNIGNRLGCVGFGLLEELLAPAFLAFAALDICDFANAAETLAEAFVPVLYELVDVEDALIGCHGATALPDFTLAALTLPPSNLGYALAA